jgi:hypothetical protein
VQPSLSPSSSCRVINSQGNNLEALVYNALQQHFSKVKQFLGRGYANTKDFLGKEYAKGKEILGKINDGYGHAKQIYDAVSPLVDKYLPNHASKTWLTKG